MSLDAQIQAGFTAVGNVVKTKISASEKGANNGVATLDGAGKLTASQLPASAVGGLSYQGVWNASTNSPTIPTAAAGNKGYYYKVSVAGATTVDTINDWKVGDWIASNGSTWDKIDNTDAVSSVAGKTGAITLGTSDISGLDTALGNKAASTHTHSISDVTGLQTALDDKATSASVTTLSTNIGATNTDYVAVFNAALV